jgi:hypothetical protein
MMMKTKLFGMTKPLKRQGFQDEWRPRKAANPDVPPTDVYRVYEI